MYKILRKQVLRHSIKLMEIKVPLVANKARPGQFVIVRINETGERIPLTIADFSKVDGTITVIFQEVGKSTIQMGQMDTGDSFENVVGPLGRSTEIENYGKVVVVGGGVGIAPIFPIARGLKLAKNRSSSTGALGPNFLPVSKRSITPSRKGATSTCLPLPLRFMARTDG